jgi:hypothetical protein
MNEPDMVRAWAVIDRDFQLAKREILKKHGHTWPSFIALAKVATEQCPDLLNTEFGIIQKLPNVPIQYSIRRGTEDTSPMLSKKRLRLTLIEEEESNGITQ